MADAVTLFEVGPRDGLQNEPRSIAAKDKIKLVNDLSACGFQKIEVTSFVSPKWVPQMADAAEVLSTIDRRAGVSYAALTPNARGFENAVAAKADEVAIFGAASEGFSQANINCSIAESLARLVPIIEAARTADIPVRGYVSCITECPYDGAVPPDTVAAVAQDLFDMGCYEISLGDTIGAATPTTINAVLDAVLERLPAAVLAGHYHDTNGQALANIEASLARGVRVFDAAVGGLGGCPYAPGAKGNVATEDVAMLCESIGYTTNLNMPKLLDAVALLSEMIGAPQGGRAHTWLSKQCA